MIFQCFNCGSEYESDNFRPCPDCAALDYEDFGDDYEDDLKKGVN